MKNIISRNKIIIVLSGIVVCLLLGSFYDLQVSTAVYDKSNWFGLIFAAYGQGPSAFAMAGAGGLLIYTMDKKRMVSLIPSVLFGILLIVFGVFMGFFEPIEYLVTVPKVVLVLISIIVTALTIYAFIRILKDNTDAEKRRFAYFIIFFVITQMIVINVIKVPWGRPRMRLIEEYPEIMFQDWWVIGSSIKDKYLALGVGSNEFKSFPSGHTASALNIFIITVLPYLNKKLENKKNLFFIISVVFTVLVAISRIIMGAHFITDVTVGFLVGFIIYLASLKIFYK